MVKRTLMVVACLGICLAASVAVAADGTAVAENTSPSAQTMWILWALAPAGALLAIFSALAFYRNIMGKDEGTDTMREIASHVRAGANAYLRQQYKIVAIVVLVLFAVFLAMAFLQHTQNPWMPFAFLAGAVASGLCGFLGMRTATNASARTAGSRNIDQ